MWHLTHRGISGSHLHSQRRALRNFVFRGSLLVGRKTPSSLMRYSAPVSLAPRRFETASVCLQTADHNAMATRSMLSSGLAYAGGHKLPPKDVSVSVERIRSRELDPRTIWFLRSSG